MEITARRAGGLLVIDLAGRMDGMGAQQVADALQQNLTDTDTAIIFDTGGVDYISSAGLRVFQEYIRKMSARNGVVAVCRPQEFVEKILKMGGFISSMAVYADVDAALGALTPSQPPHSGDRQFSGAGWTLSAEHLFNTPGTLTVTGNLQQVHAGNVTIRDVKSGAGCARGYWTGIGAPGKELDATAPLLGEMIGLNGAVFWVPTDGNLIPDFFTAEHFASSGMTCFSLFGVGFNGPFTDILRFQSENPAGLSLSELYGAVFRYLRDTYPDYTGVCALVMKATIGGLCSRDMKTSLLAACDEQVKNGPVGTLRDRSIMIMPFDRSVHDRISVVDVTPKYAGDVLIGVGYGIDPAVAQHACPPGILPLLPDTVPGTEGNAVFLNTRGAVFKNVPWDTASSLESQIDNVISNGEFVGLHNLLNITTVRSALVGILPISSIRNEP